MSQLFQLECEWELIQSDRCFWDAFEHYREDYMGGRTPLWLAENLSEEAGGKIYLKRGDGNDTALMGPALGQLLMWKRIGYSKAAAEQGNGAWGHAVSRAAAVLDMECTLFSSLPEAIDWWAAHSGDTAMVMTGDWGPYPYTEAVSAFQKITGEEMRTQLLEKEGKLPAVIAAGLCPENVLAGLYAPFMEDAVELYGGEYRENGRERQEGIGGGMKTLGYLCGWKGFSFTRMERENLPVLGPELAYQVQKGRIRLEGVTREEAGQAQRLAASREGLRLSWPDACALALAVRRAAELREGEYAAVFLNQGTSRIQFNLHS